ncbi:putative phosphatase [Fusarium oxysporum f. sp. rapae]|uniref:Putative phosphatase n=1 Tax=Fusarium oxysporum f. sp. rapae TaxID=485398 RepID=A0A8J5UFX7_FUSOX|nr:putative phosphatase [Fusarium oxysporum f. sp. rapae]
MADLSSQVQDTTKDTASSKEQESPGAFNSPSPSLALIVPIAVNLESVPRSGAGVVNDAGEVLDEAGKTVGKVADTDNLQNLVGNTVNQAGDVVSSSGDVLGKTLPIEQGKPEEEEDSHDEEKSEYTTQSKEKKSGGLGSAIGSVTGAFGKVVGGATGAVGDTAKGATDTVGDTAKGATDTVGDTAEGATDTVGDATEGIANKSEATSQATETKTPAETPGAPEVKGETPDVKSRDQDQKGISLEDHDAPDAGDKLKEIPPESEEAKEATGKAEETAEGVPEQAKDIPEEAKEDVTSKVDEQDVPKPEDVEEKLQEKTEGAQDEIPSGEAPGDDGDKSKAGDDLKSVAPGEEAAGVTDEVQDKAVEGEEAAKDLPEDAQSKAAEGEEAAEGKLAEGEEAAKDLPEDAQSKAAEGEEAAEGKLAEGEEAAKDLPEDAQSKAAEGEEAAEGKLAEGEETAEGKVAEGEEVAGDATEEAKDKVAEGEEAVEEKAAEGEEAAKELDFSILKGTTVDKEGNLVNEKGAKLGKVVEGELKQLIGLSSDDQGVIWDKTGKQLGKAEPIPEWDREQLDFSILKGTTVDKEGNLVNDKGHLIGKVTEGEIKQLIGLTADEQGTIWDKTGKKVGKAEPLPEWERGEQKDYSILKGTTVDKNGNLVNEKGHLFGKVVEGEIKQLIGLASDDQGTIWDRTGKAVGKAEPLPEWERGEQKDFSILKGAVVDKEGGLTNDKGDTIGKVTEGEIRQLVGLKADENGKIWRDGKVVGQAEPLAEWDRVQKKDCSILKGSKVNKVGKLVDANGTVVGKVVEGELKELVGKRADENGNIWNDSGEVIGKAEPVSISEREDKSFAPFEHFPGATVESDGRVMYQGEQVGEVIEGDPKQLKGSEVDEDGDILDRRGNTVGKAKRWEAPEAEEEKPVDNSALAGKRVNKAGNLVSESGEIYGRVIEGDVQKLVGRMSDRDGNIRSESGDIIGKAELVSEGERGGKKEGPFAQLKNCTVGKDGKVVNGAGEVVGRLVIGDAKVLAGRAVDDDGEITDSNGNVIGKAERWEEPEKEQKHNPLAGRKVNREGNVVDADGNIIGKLTSGELLDCAGKEIDEDGDVFNQKGSVIGHVSLLEDIPKEEEPEPEGETEEERLKREQAEAEEAKQAEEAEKNKKLAQQLAYQIEQTLERLRPICKSINDKISAAEAQKPEDRDEEELVRQVKPLIEDGGKILTETNGIIRGLDPDGRIARNAKQKTAGGEATPEEAHLANLLKELSTEIQTTIEEGKRKLEGMPHAKKEINPLWGLLAEPLFQIVAAVGLLLSGVLGLVGKLLGPILGPLLNGLGLGGLLDGLLGGLGLKKILGGLGLGDVVGTVTALSTINNHHAQLASGVAFLNDATMRLFLIRHGETVDNVANLYAGSRDSALTAHGVMQAQRLASHLAEHVAIDRIFSSNLSRAVHTAQAILDAQKRATDLKLIQVPELREKDFGTGEGTKFGAVTKHEGSETPQAMRKRVGVFLDEHLPRLDEDSTVCIVAHGISLGTFYKALRDRTSSSAGPDAEPEGQASAFVRPSWSNTGYIEALITRDSSDKHLQMRVVKINSVDHLKGLRKTRGGIGSAKFDAKQKTMDSFFKPTSRKRKLEDEDIVSR